MTLRRDNGLLSKQTARSVSLTLPRPLRTSRHHPYRPFHSGVIRPMRLSRSVHHIPSKAKMATWSAKLGIRFAPIKEAPVRYPQLDFARSPESKNADAESAVCAARDAHAAVEPASGGTAAPEGEDKPPAKAPGDAPLADPVPHETSIPYKICPDLLTKARRQPQGATGSWYNYSMYRRTLDDGSEQKVRVHYCKRRSEMEQVLMKHFVGEPVVGFDMEWNTYATSQDGPKKNCSLIQMATPARIGLFHVAQFETSHKRFAKKELLDTSLSGPVFRQIMEDTGVLKVGVNILGDCTRLKTHLGIQPAGIFELSHQARIVEKAGGGSIDLSRKPLPLASLVSKYLHLPMHKGSVRTSNWHLPLNEAQVRYAATDAYAGLQLYHVLEAQRLKLQPSPLAPALAELKLPLSIEYPPGGSDESVTEESETDWEDEPVIFTASRNTRTVVPLRIQPLRGIQSKDTDVSSTPTLPE